MMWAIINGQNFQIHQMQDYLAEKSYAESDICEPGDSAPSMAPIFAPTPRPTPSPTVTPGNPTSSPAPAPTAAPVVAPTPLPSVALAAADSIAAASSSSSGGSDTITTQASGNIIATGRSDYRRRNNWRSDDGRTDDCRRYDPWGDDDGRGDHDRLRHNSCGHRLARGAATQASQRISANGVVVAAEGGRGPAVRVSLHRRVSYSVGHVGLTALGIAIATVK